MWRFHWVDERDGDQIFSRQKPEGLLMAEALARCPPIDRGEGEDAVAAEYEAIVELFNAIERGARHGVELGMSPSTEEEAENGS